LHYSFSGLNADSLAKRGLHAIPWSDDFATTIPDTKPILIAGPYNDLDRIVLIVDHSQFYGYGLSSTNNLTTYPLAEFQLGRLVVDKNKLAIPAASLVSNITEPGATEYKENASQANDPHPYPPSA
jgi:hypothetical protein